MSAVAQTGAGNVTVNSDPSNTTITCAKPGNTADGDALVAYVFGSNGGAVQTPPAGWTQAGGTTSVRTVFSYVKPIPSAAAETATNYTWTTTGGAARLVVIIFRVTGADLSSLVDAIGAATTSGVGSIVAPAASPTNAGDLLLGFWAANDNTTTLTVVTEPASMSEIGHASTAPAASTYCMVSQEQLAASGSTGTRTATVSPSSPNGVTGHLLTLTALPVTNAPAGSADGTGAAGPAATSAAVPAGSAAGQGDAVWDTAGGTLDLELVGDNPVDGIGLAFDVDPVISVNAGSADATGQAGDVTRPPGQGIPATADGLGEAFDPTVVIFTPPAPEVWQFNSPTQTYIERPFGGTWDRPFGPAVERVVGLTVLRVGGHWQAALSTSATDEAEADRLYYGGHIYTIDGDAAAELTAAGFGAGLTRIQ